MFQLKLTYLNVTHSKKRERILSVIWYKQSHSSLYTLRAAPCKDVSAGIEGQRWPILACASAQSDRSVRCPLTESLDTTKCINEDQMLE